MQCAISAQMMRKKGYEIVLSMHVLSLNMQGNAVFEMNVLFPTKNTQGDAKVDGYARSTLLLGEKS